MSQNIICHKEYNITNVKYQRKHVMSECKEMSSTMQPMVVGKLPRSKECAQSVRLRQPAW